MSSINLSSSASSTSNKLVFILFEFLFSDSPSFIRYSSSELLSVRCISSPSFLMIIPSSSPIALKTLSNSSSDKSLSDKSKNSSSSSSSNSVDSSSPNGTSKSNSTSVSTKLSASVSSTSASKLTSNSSCSDRDSFTNWLISSFMVEASIPFAFSAIASSTCFI